MTSAPLRVAFVMLHTSPLDVPGTKDAGGMNVVVLAQARALAGLGHDVVIYTRRSSDDVPRLTELAPGLAVVQLDAGPARVLAKSEHEAVIEAFSRQLRTALEQRPADVIHSEHWFSGIAAQPVARALRIPLAHSFHSIAAAEGTPLTEGERPESPGRLEGERRIVQEVDLLIAVSAAEQATIIDRLGADAERVRVVNLGVDTELFHPCQTRECEEDRAWVQSGGRPEVIVVGRLHPLKAFDLAIEAIAAIEPDKRPYLRIVGAPPPDGDGYARELHEAAARHGMIGTTSFDGPLRRSELAERIRRAQLMLVPSHTETFGLVALEAAASALPVIARDTGGLREAVINGRTGVLVAGDDARVWAAAVEALIDDPDRMAQMGEAARQHALMHTWADSAAELIDAYRAVIAG